MFSGTLSPVLTYGGYNDLYDRVFDIATSMNFAKFEFSDGKRNYIIWAWKGDYLTAGANLGAGAELGIYTDPIYLPGIDVSLPLKHWRVDKTLAMKMEITLINKETGEKIFHFVPGLTGEKGDNPLTWWITGFNPAFPDMKAESLRVIYELDFSNNIDLYKAFMAEHSIDERWTFDKNNYKATFLFD